MDESAFRENGEEEEALEDEKIIELYWQRKEKALSETKTKYGRLIAHVARQILPDPLQDRLMVVGHCVNLRSYEFLVIR